MTDLVFYLLVFLAVGVFFLFIHLVIGKLIRPDRPDAEKMTIYECGEPTVGSAWIQFDLRYYVVALLFVVFDVEVAFFFPWAIVFGKANELSRTESVEHRAEITRDLVPAELGLAYLEGWKPPAQALPGGTGKGPGAGKAPVPKGGGLKGKIKDAEGKPPPPPAPVKEPANPFAGRGVVATPPDVAPISQTTAATWAWIAFADIFVFFGVLMVGFAYLWKRGDIDWVRSTAAETEPMPSSDAGG